MGETVAIGLGVLFALIILAKFLTSSQSLNYREINKLIESGMLDKAKQALQKSIRSSKFSPDAHFLLASVYIKANQPDYAIMELKSIIKNNKYGIYAKKFEVFNLIYTLYLRLNKLEDAYNQFLLFEKSYPEDYIVTLHIGKLLIKKKEYQSALQYFHKTLKLHSTDPDAIAGIGICYYFLNDLEKAHENLDQAVKLDRRNTEAHYYMALVLHKKGLYDQAIMEYENALRNKSLKLQCLYGIGRCYQQKEIITKAIDTYEEAVRLIETEAEKFKHNYNKRMMLLTNPIVLEIRYKLAECYMTDRNFAAAMEQWQEIDSVKPGYKDVKLKLQQNARYGKDRIQDFLIAKEMELEKISRYIIGYLGYIVKKLEKKSKEEFIVEAVGNSPEAHSGKVLILIKRSFHPLGERDCSDFYEEMQKRNIGHGIIISPTGVNANAIKFALGKPIEFVGKNQMMQLLKKYELRI